MKVGIIVVFLVVSLCCGTYNAGENKIYFATNALGLIVGYLLITNYAFVTRMFLQEKPDKVGGSQVNAPVS